MRDPCCRQLGFDAGFAEDEDFVFWWGGCQDQGDVDCAAVGGGEDFFERGGDAHAGQLEAVVGAGFGAVVRDEDDLFAAGAEEGEGGYCVGEEVVA